MKKKITTLLVGTMLVASLTACGSNNTNTAEATQTPEATTEATAEATTAETSYADGTFEGVGAGNNGDIKVSVTIEEGKITDVTVVEHAETAGIYENAEAAVPAAIVEAQSTDVDTVAGATNSSNGIIEAVNNALAEASK